MALEGANSLMKVTGTKPLYRELATTMSRLATDRQDGQRDTPIKSCVIEAVPCEPLGLYRTKDRTATY
jgi:hypothetical protein